jgi:anti-sigma factor RsiW
MSHMDRHDEWAWERIEAMADGSLTRQERRRMLEAMHADERLSAAVARARALREGLRDLGRAPIPAGLSARLMSVPARSMQRPTHWSWVAVPVAVAVVVIATVALVMQPAPPPEDPRVAAVRDFTVAMTYLQKSAAYTGGEVTDAVSGGLLDALAAGGNSLFEKESDDENGG